MSQLDETVLKKSTRFTATRSLPGWYQKIVGGLVNSAIKLLTGILCRVDSKELAKVPASGPLILVANHVNFLEVPVLITRLLPRRISGFSKLETWDNPAKAFLFNIWGGIPLRRGEADHEAFRLAEQIIREGTIFAISPEGTRSGNGRLQIGHPGVALLAARTGAPLLPVAYHGSELFWQNIKRLKRTDFIIRVGSPFKVITNGKPLSRDVREQITREIMWQMAALLPPENRGVYSDLEQATQEYLVFE